MSKKLEKKEKVLEVGQRKVYIQKNPAPDGMQGKMIGSNHECRNVGIQKSGYCREIFS